MGGNKSSKAGVLYLSYDGLCDPLGQSQVVPYLVKLARQGIRIIVLSFEKRARLTDAALSGETARLLKDNGIIWQSLRYHKRPPFISTLYDMSWAYFKGLFLAAKHKINIVHARGYVPGVVAQRLKQDAGLRFIFDMRGFWAEEKIDAGFWKKEDLAYRFVKHCEKKMLSACDQVVVLTHKAERVLRDCFGVDETKIAVIPTCVDTDKFTPLRAEKAGFLKERIVVLYSGSVGAFYGFSEAVIFFQALYAKEKRSFFLAIVNNHQQAARALIQESGIPAGAYRIMSLSYNQMPQWISQADLSLIFYHRQHSAAGCCPTKLGESLACAVPVLINASVGDCDEIISSGRAGFILRNFESGQLNSAADEFLTTLRSKDDLRLRCRQLAEKLFSLESGSALYHKVYQSVI